MIKRTHPGDLVMHSVRSQVPMPKEESPTEAHSMDAAAVSGGWTKYSRIRPEPEHADDLADEFLEDVNDNSQDTRQAVLPLHLGFLIDHAQESFSTQANNQS